MWQSLRYLLISLCKQQLRNVSCLFHNEKRSSRISTINRSSVSQVGKRGRFSQICTRLISLSPLREPMRTEKSRALLCSMWGKILPRSSKTHFVQTGGDKMRWYSEAGAGEGRRMLFLGGMCGNILLPVLRFERKSKQKLDHRRKPSLLELTGLSALQCRRICFSAELRSRGWDTWLLQAPLQGEGHSSAFASC